MLCSVDPMVWFGAFVRVEQPFRAAVPDYVALLVVGEYSRLLTVH